MEPMKIFFISSEVEPFAKTGGLADVSSALPKALKALDCDVRVIMPKYRVIDERKYILRDVIRLKGIPIQLGNKVKKVSIKSAFIPDTKIQIYFVDDPEFFNRDELYTDIKTGKDYTDSPQRFILFARAALETLKKLYWEPDIIHCNDWQTAIVPYLLKSEYKDDPFFENTSTLLTTHNLNYQGIFSADVMKNLNPPEDFDFEDSPFEYHGKFNFLKSGIHYADMINTVSSTYAKEVQNNEELGAGLESDLKHRKKQFHGILNGIDTSVWKPDIDPFIPQSYSIRKISMKVENKKALLDRTGLSFSEKTPVIGIVSRLAEQKGFDLISEIFDNLMGLNLQIIVLGRGEKKYQQFFSKAKKNFPEKVYFHSKNFAEDLAHLIEAGSDMFLMPSQFEPCGLNQMYSLTYGTIPIVRKTGGLADTVVDFDEKTGKGTGFVFENYNSKELLQTIKRALKLYKNQETWAKLMKNGMRKDFSWQTSAKKYIKLYQKIMKD